MQGFNGNTERKKLSQDLLKPHFSELTEEMGVTIESASDQGGNLAASYGAWGTSKWRLWLRLCMVGGGEGGMGRQGAPPGLHSR